MMFHSILIEEKDGRKTETPEEPGFFADLYLDQLIEAIAAPKQKQAYNLKPFFYTPMRDAETIRYRHEVMQNMDEELGRMSAIVDSLTPNAMLLFNESFAATNEREGSEIARQVTRALLERRIKVFFVTHQYKFANSMSDRNMNGTIFLRAERQADGTRTFKLLEGEPLQTSYGQDLYHQIFGEAVATSGPPRPTS
ncbi:MAG: hypothetical protein JXM73_15885 [Anaerolineae bacterium]|nr:hypothetical protein [Anaerolineae bacterium]